MLHYTWGTCAGAFRSEFWGIPGRRHGNTWSIQRLSSSPCTTDTSTAPCIRGFLPSALHQLSLPSQFSWLDPASSAGLPALPTCSYTSSLLKRAVTLTSMSVLLIVQPKCMPAASHAAPGDSRWVCRWDRQTDVWTPDRFIMLSASRSPANIIIKLELLTAMKIEPTSKLHYLLMLWCHWLYNRKGIQPLKTYYKSPRCSFLGALA